MVGDGPHPQYEVGELGVLPDHKAADPLVFRPLASGTRDRGRRCRAYTSTSYARWAGELFSFVPARPLGDGVRFERPLLEPSGALSGLLQPNLRMQARVLEVGEQQIADAWTYVRDVVEGLGLALGVRAELPT